MRGSLGRRFGVDVGRLERLLESRTRRRLRGKQRKGAVLVPLLEMGPSSEPYVLFQRRSAEMRHHANQISFPGGMQDGEEESAEQTALRETREEIGLGQDRVRVLGTMSDIYSKRGDVITPLLGFIGSYQSEEQLKNLLILSPAEVQEVYLMPLRDFLDPAYVEDDILRHGTHTMPAKRYTKHPDKVIWGLSAVILEEVLKVVEDAIKLESRS